jgi:motility quorum-sensing regulator / GCU-specific mRNA interferase toxin
MVRTLIEDGKVRATVTALAGAVNIGADFESMIATVMALTMADFYKSMTTYHDHKLWHDVYRPVTPLGEVYLKLTVIDEVVIISFKEL